MMLVKAIGGDTVTRPTAMSAKMQAGTLKTAGTFMNSS